ncbi:sensor domain-containing diguanylate cyclase [Shewanella sp. AS1]|uniref:diguanylate cyclase domain-containing protein n=1 Tax=Shewanella sp. AS1 TaxID=2907626 RepID=UPI001F17F517|nr:diguanylate cyclase [Shewanella sp. AS1]MCE9678393.1 sensor domain-containing diguanylate cyclase [Shewanella sp. AS1]
MGISSSRKQLGYFIFLSLFYIAIASVSILAVNQYFTEQSIAQEKDTIRKNLASARFNLETAIHIDAYLVTSLVTVITMGPELAMNNWNLIAQQVLSQAKYVRNVGVAPNDIISHEYPLSHNEKAIGLDYRTLPGQMKTILKARERQGLYIAGPLDLIQGGKGLVVRYPVFSDFPANLEYWGNVSAVIDYEQLLKNTGIIDFQGAEVALKKPVTDGTTKPIFFGSSETFKNPDMLYPIHLPGDTWQLAAKFNFNHQQQTQFIRNIIFSVGSLIFLLLYGFILLIYKNYRYSNKIALHDELTHLPNRRFILNKLRTLTNQGAEKRPFALLNIDLNGFKQINDELGHEAGDELLKHIATLLRANTDKQDTVVRFGGDEFLILLRDVSEQSQVDKIIARLQLRVQSSVLLWGSKKIVPSLSIGSAIYDDSITSTKQLLAQADKNMYVHKRRAQLKAALSHTSLAS